MDKYRIYTLLVGLLFVSMAGLFVAAAFKNGRIFMIGTPVRRREESGQFYVMVFFIGGMLASFGLFWIFVGLHK